MEQTRDYCMVDSILFEHIVKVGFPARLCGTPGEDRPFWLTENGLLCRDRRNQLQESLPLSGCPRISCLGKKEDGSLEEECLLRMGFWTQYFSEHIVKVGFPARLCGTPGEDRPFWLTENGLLCRDRRNQLQESLPLSGCPPNQLPGEKKRRWFIRGGMPFENGLLVQKVGDSILFEHITLKVGFPARLCGTPGEDRPFWLTENGLLCRDRRNQLQESLPLSGCPRISCLGEKKGMVH
ncbi:hypothetical protein CEXT_620451 [Caerostris extrusa]|uniref:Uncharacterized protein n=1 Tax=Caerostris extrusa TaxID=172846 RepID=A0AAV4VJS7_CAEEX|nr:hypothetical protein CEXT_620451 [Caerostris extrusa]